MNYLSNNPDYIPLSVACEFFKKKKDLLLIRELYCYYNGYTFNSYPNIENNLGGCIKIECVAKVVNTECTLKDTSTLTHVALTSHQNTGTLKRMLFQKTIELKIEHQLINFTENEIPEGFSVKNIFISIIGTPSNYTFRESDCPENSFYAKTSELKELAENLNLDVNQDAISKHIGTLVQTDYNNEFRYKERMHWFGAALALAYKRPDLFIVNDKKSKTYAQHIADIVNSNSKLFDLESVTGKGLISSETIASYLVPFFERLKDVKPESINNQYGSNRQPVRKITLAKDKKQK